MSISERATTADPLHARDQPAPVRTGRLTAILSLDQLVANLGRFSLLPVLGVFLLVQDRGAGGTGVGLELFALTGASGLSALLVNRYLSRLSYTIQLAGSMVFLGTGFGILPYVHSTAALVAGLLLAGLGTSVHMALATVLVAEAIPGIAGRHRIFSLFQIAGNAAAAAGPFIADLLYRAGDARPLFAFATACYLITAVLLAVLLRLPRGLRPPRTPSRWPISRQSFAAVLGDANGRRVVLVTVVGAFVYAQFYSAFALFVAFGVHSGMWRGVLLAGSAVLIVVLQTPVTAGVGLLLRRRYTPFFVLCLGSAVFGLAMLLLGVVRPLLVAALITVVVFSLAEMIFQPMVSTAFADLRLPSQLEAFGLRQIAWTIGEAAGSLCGATAYLIFHRGGDDRAYWLVLAAACLISTFWLGSRGRREPLVAGSTAAGDPPSTLERS